MTKTPLMTKLVLSESGDREMAFLLGIDEHEGWIDFSQATPPGTAKRSHIGAVFSSAGTQDERTRGLHAIDIDLHLS